MPNLRFTEIPDSGSNTAEPPTVTVRYKCSGEESGPTVQALAISLTPPTVLSVYGLLYRQDIKIDHVGYNLWHVTVPYGRIQKPPTGSFTWNFDTTGGSVHIKASKQTVAKYPAGTAKDCKQLIGVNGDDVEGADIVIPALKLNVNFKHPQGVVTLPWVKTVARLTGKVNDSLFMTFSAGEVLFLGATGSDGSEAEAEVGLQFACSENLQDQVIGAVTGIQKEGWDISWIKWKDAADGGLPVKQPEFVYIERVYERANLAAALGFGAF